MNSKCCVQLFGFTSVPVPMTLCLKLGYLFIFFTDEIDYWEKATGQKAFLCHQIGCLKHATDGTHVQLDDSYDNRWYIKTMGS